MYYECLVPNDPSDTKRQGSKQEDVFPATLVDVVCKVAVKGHCFVCCCKFTGINSNQLDKDRISFRHTWLPG